MFPQQSVLVCKKLLGILLNLTFNVRLHVMIQLILIDSRAFKGSACLLLTFMCRSIGQDFVFIFRSSKPIHDLVTCKTSKLLTNYPDFYSYIWGILKNIGRYFLCFFSDNVWKFLTHCFCHEKNIIKTSFSKHTALKMHENYPNFFAPVSVGDEF